MVATRAAAMCIMFLAVAGFALAAAGQTVSCRARLQAARELLATMHDRNDEVSALDAGPKLAELADAAPPRCARTMLPLLVRSMQDDTDLVRFYAARAIAALGPQGRAAVPALEAATKLDKCVCYYKGFCRKRMPITSTDEIEYAVMELTGRNGDPEIYTCAHSGTIDLPPDNSAPIKSAPASQ